MLERRATVTREPSEWLQAGMSLKTEPVLADAPCRPGQRPLERYRDGDSHRWGDDR